MYKSNERRKQSERTAETRGVLVATARKLFAERGYHTTGTEDLVHTAGVTRGALYYHFQDKRDLFRAVAEQLEEELDQRVLVAASAGRDIWESIARGVDAFLEACSQQDVKQILLLDGPSVLGWKEWHELDERHALGQIEESLQALVDAGYKLAAPVKPLSLLLHGAILEGALYVANAEDMSSAQLEVSRAIQHLFRGLVQSDS